MREITVDVPRDGIISRDILDTKLEQLKGRGLLDAGVVLIQDGMLQGYLAEGELEFGLNELGKMWDAGARVRVLGDVQEEGEADLSMFVDRTPLTICAKAPVEYAVEMFGKLGLRHLCVVEEGSSKLVGVSIRGVFLVNLERLADNALGHYKETIGCLVRWAKTLSAMSSYFISPCVVPLVVQRSNFFFGSTARPL